jgi:hypothetical protein
MKRAIAIVSALALIFGGVQPASAQDAFNPDTLPLPQNSASFQIGETGEQIASSMLSAGRLSSGEQWICESTKDPACSKSKSDYIAGRGLLPPCESDSDENCVVGLAVSVGGAEFETATLIKSINGMKYSEDKSVGFYELSTPSMWEAPNSPSASGTTTYAVLVLASLSKDKGDRSFKTSGFTASVVPYREDVGESYETPYPFTVTDDPVQGKRPRSIGLGGHTYQCAWSEQGLCGVTQDYAEGTKVRLTIRISKNVGGWFQGRIKAPSISVKNFSATNNEITVTAEPAVVQRMIHVVESAKDISKTERKFASNGFAGNWDGFAVWARASNPDTFEYLNYFKKKTKDTAAGKNTFWNFSAFNSAGEGSSCLADTSKVLGIATTNAMVYDGGVPKFKRGFLDYKVAGLHYEADGVTEVMGSYDLVMRSDVARCLYGFNKAPVSATITISGEGDKNIATTVVGERGGWLKLAAYDFTFSQKTIKVKLTQKKTTITCVTTKKPIKTKKVTGFSPKCPKGYKKR